MSTLTHSSSTRKVATAKPILHLLRSLRSLPPRPWLLPSAGKLTSPRTAVKDPFDTGKQLLLLTDTPAPAPAVPKGCLAVYVGPDMRRFVIPASYLSLPRFKALLEGVAEDFGYDHAGGLTIPCDEKAFEEILRVSRQNDEGRKKSRKKLIMF